LSLAASCPQGDSSTDEHPTYAQAHEPDVLLSVDTTQNKKKKKKKENKTAVPPPFFGYPCFLVFFVFSFLVFSYFFSFPFSFFFSPLFVIVFVCSFFQLMLTSLFDPGPCRYSEGSEEHASKRRPSYVNKNKRNKNKNN
jgi:hypothetical protein